ncbi:hypothetical protein L2E82_21903 [Cichorium intybus]|uniref:Uncharacterized protein n=1 Tax=Cichorium intybus TaxID=13427 RepID=A0ACB9DXJ5_CICIN|nr:hypothetical protein L2E82_21903 [Cichorium intybus]
MICWWSLSFVSKTGDIRLSVELSTCRRLIGYNQKCGTFPMKLTGTFLFHNTHSADVFKLIKTPLLQKPTQFPIHKHKYYLNTNSYKSFC